MDMVAKRKSEKKKRILINGNLEQFYKNKQYWGQIKRQQNSKCKQCGYRNKTTNYILRGCWLKE